MPLWRRSDDPEQTFGRVDSGHTLLQPLGRPCRKLAAALHLGEVPL
jgi:hypothetical protein